MVLKKDDIIKHESEDTVLKIISSDKHITKIMIVSSTRLADKIGRIFMLSTRFLENEYTKENK